MELRRCDAPGRRGRAPTTTLGRDHEALIVTDGAMWIWNLAGDRFPGARQRVHDYHVSQHLWRVAHALHPTEVDAACAWVRPLLEKPQADAGCAVITESEQLRERVEGAARGDSPAGGGLLAHPSRPIELRRGEEQR